MSANGTAFDDREAAVSRRYAAAAQTVEPALCCPVEYAGDFLSVIPPDLQTRFPRVVRRWHHFECSSEEHSDDNIDSAEAGESPGGGGQTGCDPRIDAAQEFPVV